MKRRVHHTASIYVGLTATICWGIVGSTFAGADVAGSAPPFAPASSGATASAKLVPATYEAGHFYATPVTHSGQLLKLVVDTGGGGFGGMYWISTDAATRLNLKTSKCTSDGQTFDVTTPPEFQPGHALPPVRRGPCGRAILVLQTRSGQLRIPIDGQLGVGYLSDRIWTFDYPARQLWVQPPTWRPDPSAHDVPLGILRGGDGRPTTGFARIMIDVAGTPISMLFDTGAMWEPTSAGKRTVHGPTSVRYGATSFVATSTFNEWHRRHPNWPVAANGDGTFGPQHPMRLIEVPNVEIAGWSVGPVWFTERPDAGFSGTPQSMSSMLDGQVYGAVGGNVFRHFRVTVDYPRATAYFRCERGCATGSSPR